MPLSKKTAEVTFTGENGTEMKITQTNGMVMVTTSQEGFKVAETEASDLMSGIHQFFITITRP